MLCLKSRFCFLTIMTVNEESCGTAGRREKGCLVFFLSVLQAVAMHVQGG